MNKSSFYSTCFADPTLCEDKEEAETPIKPKKSKRSKSLGEVDLFVHQVKKDEGKSKKSKSKEEKIKKFASERNFTLTSLNDDDDEKKKRKKKKTKRSVSGGSMSLSSEDETISVMNDDSVSLVSVNEDEPEDSAKKRSRKKKKKKLESSMSSFLSSAEITTDDDEDDKVNIGKKNKKKKKIERVSSFVSIDLSVTDDDQDEMSIAGYGGEGYDNSGRSKKKKKKKSKNMDSISVISGDFPTDGDGDIVHDLKTTSTSQTKKIRKQKIKRTASFDGDSGLETTASADEDDCMLSLGDDNDEDNAFDSDGDSEKAQKFNSRRRRKMKKKRRNLETSNSVLSTDVEDDDDAQYVDEESGIKTSSRSKGEKKKKKKEDSGNKISGKAIIDDDDDDDDNENDDYSREAGSVAEDDQVRAKKKKKKNKVRSKSGNDLVSTISTDDESVIDYEMNGLSPRRKKKKKLQVPPDDDDSFSILSEIIFDSKNFDDGDDGENTKKKKKEKKKDNDSLSLISTASRDDDEQDLENSGTLSEMSKASKADKKKRKKKKNKRINEDSSVVSGAFTDEDDDITKLDGKTKKDDPSGKSKTSDKPIGEDKQKIETMQKMQRSLSTFLKSQSSVTQTGEQSGETNRPKRSSVLSTLTHLSNTPLFDEDSAASSRTSTTSAKRSANNSDLGDDDDGSTSSSLASTKSKKKKSKSYKRQGSSMSGTELPSLEEEDLVSDGSKEINVGPGKNKKTEESISKKKCSDDDCSVKSSASAKKETSERKKKQADSGSATKGELATPPFILESKRKNGARLSKVIETGGSDEENKQATMKETKGTKQSKDSKEANSDLEQTVPSVKVSRLRNLFGFGSEEYVSLASRRKLKTKSLRELPADTDSDEDGGDVVGMSMLEKKKKPRDMSVRHLGFFDYDDFDESESTIKVDREDLRVAKTEGGGPDVNENEKQASSNNSLTSDATSDSKRSKRSINDKNKRSNRNPQDGGAVDEATLDRNTKVASKKTWKQATKSLKRATSEVGGKSRSAIPSRALQSRSFSFTIEELGSETEDDESCDFEDVWRYEGALPPDARRYGDAPSMPAVFHNNGIPTESNRTRRRSNKKSKSKNKKQDMNTSAGKYSDDGELDTTGNDDSVLTGSDNFEDTSIETADDSIPPPPPKEPVFRDFPRHHGSPCVRFDKRKKRNTKQRLRFSYVFLKEHKVCLGDSPACSDTMPLSLDWEHARERCWTVENFERIKFMYPRVGLDRSFPKKRGTRQNPMIENTALAQLLSRNERYSLLIDVGSYTREQVIQEEQQLHRKLQREHWQVQCKIELEWKLGIFKRREDDQNKKIESFRGNDTVASAADVDMMISEDGTIQSDDESGAVLFVTDPSTGEVMVVPV